MQTAQKLDREALEHELARHPVHDIPEPGRAHRRHSMRHRADGYRWEAVTAIRALARRHSPAQTRLLVIARPRSGTTLLMNLLGQVPGVKAGGEVLHSGRLFPNVFLTNLARTADAPIWACKMLSYQMLTIQPISRPVSFLAAVERNGYRFVHLRRDTKSQAISLVRAGTSRIFHVREENKDRAREIRLDPERVVARARWAAAYLDFEDRLLEGFNHLRLDYEAALESEVAHQTTVDKVCTFLGIQSAPVSAGLRRVNEHVRIVNREEVEAALKRAGFA